MTGKFMVMVSVAAMALMCHASHAQQGRQFVPPFYVFNPTIPRDVVAPGDAAVQPAADIMAWDAFIALNWPVPNPIVQRGAPDRQNIIGGVPKSGGFGAPPAMPNGPTVWETFKDATDIFLNPPTRPTPFDQVESIPPACKNLANANPVAALRTLTMTSKFGELLNGDKQADGNRLVDQNGQDVWYEVKVNRTYYDYVVKNAFYDSRKQAGKIISFPASSNDTSAIGTVKVKAAWKVMGAAGSKQPDDASKFYTTEALVLDPRTNVCAKVQLGLVGLHIVMKTKQFPQWLWATFEQVDNAPNEGSGPAAGAHYNFFNADCKSCSVNTPPTKEEPQAPTQVERVTPVAATSYNKLYRTALATLRMDNVWQNYMLVDAQWGQNPTPIGKPNQPGFLANTTMETYLQQPTEPNGCINCHGFADKTDLDFQTKFAYPRQTTGLSALLGIPGVMTKR